MLLIIILLNFLNKFFLFYRKLSNGKESKFEVLVIFGEFKCIICFKKGDDLKIFCYYFLRVFFDIFLEDVVLGNVKFQKFDYNFNEYVEVKYDLGLEENDKLKVIVILKNENKVYMFYSNVFNFSLVWLNSQKQEFIGMES